MKIPIAWGIGIALLMSGCGGGGAGTSAPAAAARTSVPSTAPLATTPTATTTGALASPVGQTIVETFKVTRFVVGQQAANETAGSVVMANLLALPQGGWRMYYNASAPGQHRVRFTESSTLESWSTPSTALEGSATPTDGEHLLGGPSVQPLPDGRFRMYYRCAPDHAAGTAPAYTLRSAISNDGLTFTREGIRIGIAPQDPSSPFSLAGHGTFYSLADGRWASIFSANEVGDNGPSSLYFATSADGLSWGGFRKLWDDCHDPIVVKRNGAYVMYATYLSEASVRAVSADGVTWPSMLDRVRFIDAQGTEFVGNDIGALVLPDASMRVFSNYSARTGPDSASTDIVMCAPEP